MYKLFLLSISLILFITSCQNNEIDYNDNGQLCDRMYALIQNDQKYRVNDVMNDSLWGLQIKIDNYNCEQLIKIIKKRGWPSKESFHCDKPPSGVIIFRHAQEKYFSKIENIIKNELSAGRIGSGDYNFIKNHLEGRPEITMEQLLENPIIQ